MIGPFWELWQRTYFVKLAIAFTTCCSKNSLQKSLLFSLFKTLWHNIHGLSLLFGVLKCSECGAAMTSHNYWHEKKNGYSRYIVLQCKSMGGCIVSIRQRNKVIHTKLILSSPGEHHNVVE